MIASETVGVLARMQDGLNALIDPSWRSVRSLDDWSLAITMESTELADSYPWKWWKSIKAAPDMSNVKIELVDILHFSLSGSMQIGAIGEEGLSASVKERMSTPLMPFRPTENGYTRVSEDELLYFPLTECANAVVTMRNIIQLAERYRFDDITKSVIAAAGDVGFNLVAYYVAKHTLNYIRQMRGYKEGTYVKVNRGVEDNELLHRCIEGVTVEECVAAERYADVWNDIIAKVYDAFEIPHSERRAVEDWIAGGKSAKRDRPDDALDETHTYTQ